MQGFLPLFVDHRRTEVSNCSRLDCLYLCAWLMKKAAAEPVAARLVATSRPSWTVVNSMKATPKNER